MSRFNPGDVVLVNGSQVATIKVYDEGSGQLVLVQELPGEATNEIYGPIGSYRLQHLVAPAVASDHRPGEEPEADEAEADTEEEGPKDQITTSGSFL